MKAEQVNKVMDALKDRVYEFEKRYTCKVEGDDESRTIPFHMIKVYPIDEMYGIGNIQWIANVCLFYDLTLSVRTQYEPDHTSRLYLLIF